MPDPLNTTLQRVKQYEHAGADGIFMPGIVHPEDIRTVVANTHLPLNVMCMPGLSSFDELSALGVKRISMGGFLFDKIYGEVSRLANAVERDNNFSSIL